jgi:hypothetical protein
MGSTCDNNKEGDDNRGGKHSMTMMTGGGCIAQQQQQHNEEEGMTTGGEMTPCDMTLSPDATAALPHTGCKGGAGCKKHQKRAIFLLAKSLQTLCHVLIPCHASLG